MRLVPKCRIGQRHARLEPQVPEFEHPLVGQLPPILATMGRRRGERYTESCGGDETKDVATRRFDSFSILCIRRLLRADVVSPTSQMSRAPQRHHRTDRWAGRLHLRG